MPRTITVVRHAFSEANDRNNIGTLAFGSPDAPLAKPLGLSQARDAGRLLVSKYGINPGRTPVAASKMRRTFETAGFAGFTRIKAYASLNEIDHGMPGIELKEMLKRKQIPEVAVRGARKLLESPPTEDIWFTHGLVIAGLTIELSQTSHYDHPRPAFCEVRQFTIG